MASWYEQAFGPWYPKLYPHRDRNEARRAMTAVETWLPATGSILDIGCGSGRHLQLLRESGRAAFGIDRSRTLMNTATGLDGFLIRGDMRRLPFASASFSGLLCMFTTFGYFGSRGAHIDLLAEFARVAGHAGRLVLDYLNEPRVREQLEARTEREVDGHAVVETRSIEPGEEGDRVIKQITISAPGGAEVEHFEENVALYARDELLEMLHAAGWEEETSLGDYDGGSWGPSSSRLLIIAGKREEA